MYPKKLLVVASSFIFENDRCQEDLTLVKTAVMNPTKSKDFKLTQSTEEVVERINALHGYEINITSVQPNTDRCFRSIQIYQKYKCVYIYSYRYRYCMYLYILNLNAKTFTVHKSDHTAIYIIKSSDNV